MKSTVTGFQPRHTGTQWWIAVCVIVFINFATLVGNAAVIIGLCRVKRAPSHYPLTSLVAADMLVGLAVQPIAAATELFVFNLNQYVCGFWSTMDVLCCTASILSLSALGWERWAGITAPLARVRRARRARILAYSVWPVSALVALPNAFITSPHHFDPGKLEKGCPVNINTGYVFFSITLSFYLPAVLLVVMYACILRALAAPPPIRAHRGRSPCRNTMVNPAERNNNSEIIEIWAVYPTDISEADTGVRWRPAGSLVCSIQLCKYQPDQRGYYKHPQGANLKIPGTSNCPAATPKCTAHEAFIQRQQQVTRTIVMLMALFLICWTPYFIILPIDSLYDCVTDSTWLWCTWLGYANSALNPLVYATRLRMRFAKRMSRSSQITLPLAPRA